MKLNDAIVTRINEICKEKGVKYLRCILERWNVAVGNI